MKRLFLALWIVLLMVGWSYAATFGNNAGGSSTAANVRNFLLGRFQAPASGTITALTFKTYNGTAGSINVQAGIYADSSNTPGNLIASSGSQAVEATFNGNTTVNISAAISSGSYYWIGFQVNSTDANWLSYYNTPDAGNTFARIGSWTFGSWPNNPAGMTISNDLSASVIATYNSYTPPTCTTQATTAIAYTAPYSTATGHGTVTAGTPDEAGIVWATHATPTVSDNKVVGSATSGAFTASLTGLPASTLIYCRAYVHDATSGYVYGGSDVTFRTHPNTYYFDAVSGNNTNDGLTIGAPKQTIAGLTTLLTNDAEVGSGDIFAFKKDTQPLGANSTQIFDGSLNLYGVSRTLYNATFTSYGADSYPPVFTSTGVYTKTVGGAGWTDAGGGIYTIAETPTGTMQFYEDFVALPMSAGATLVDGRKWYVGGGTLYYKPSTGTPADHRTEKYDGTKNPTFVLGSYIAVDKITWSNLQFSGSDGIVYNNTSGAITSGTVTGCKFNNGAFFSSAGASGVSITSNTFNNSTPDAIRFVSTGDVAISNVTISNNICRYINYYPDNTTIYPLAHAATDPTSSEYDILYLQNLTNSTITNNELSGQTGAGTWSAAIDVYCGAGVDYNGTSVIVANNYIHDVGIGIICDYSTSASNHNHKIYNNIVVNTAIDGASGYGIWVGGIQNSSFPSYVANNTVYNVTDALKVTDTTGDYWRFYNNIVHTATSFTTTPNLAAHVLFNYNDYYPGTGNTFNGGSFATWKAGGKDANSVISNPVFANAGGSYALSTDFRLSATSPLAVKMQGTNLSTLFTTDYAGTTRDLWGMGAFSGTSGGGGLSLGLGVSGGNKRP